MQHCYNQQPIFAHACSFPFIKLPNVVFKLSMNSLYLVIHLSFDLKFSY